MILYHITKHFMGRKVGLWPMMQKEFPIEAESNRYSAEPDIRKICCSPIIEGAVAAVPLMGQTFVYATDVEDEEFCWAYGVKDSHVTHECWVLVPTIWECVGVLDYSISDYSYDSTIAGHMLDDFVSPDDNRDLREHLYQIANREYVKENLCDLFFPLKNGVINLEFSRPLGETRLINPDNICLD